MKTNRQTRYHSKLINFDRQLTDKLSANHFYTILDSCQKKIMANPDQPFSLRYRLTRAIRRQMARIIENITKLLPI